MDLVWFMVFNATEYDIRDFMNPETYFHLISDLRQIGSFLLVLWFPPLIKLTSGFLHQ
jgi:hypothetical protein